MVSWAATAMAARTDASNFFELADFRGSFRCTTALGAVTGLELHLGVVDDVVKGRQEAFSKTVRDRTWSWFTDDFRTRFNKDAGLLAIGTRWHVDDMLGRLVDKYPEAKVLRYPAIAEIDERGRRAGEALFPQWKPLSFLHEQKRGHGRRPDQAVKHRSDGRECREPSTLSHLGFQPVQKTPTIHVSSGFIWGIPAKFNDRVQPRPPKLSRLPDGRDRTQLHHQFRAGTSGRARRVALGARA
jgi:hypothetical protein